MSTYGYPLSLAVDSQKCNFSVWSFQHFFRKPNGVRIPKSVALVLAVSGPKSLISHEPSIVHQKNCLVHVRGQAPLIYHARLLLYYALFMRYDTHVSTTFLTYWFTLSDPDPMPNSKHRGGSSGMAEAMEAQMRSSARVQCTFA